MMDRVCKEAHRVEVAAAVVVVVVVARVLRWEERSLRHMLSE
jgi:hypothetical protein